MGLQKTVPESLESVPLITIRKFSRKCWRYIDLYKNSLSEKLVEYAVKKYKTHRRIPNVFIRNKINSNRTKEDPKIYIDRSGMSLLIFEVFMQIFSIYSNFFAYF